MAVTGSFLANSSKDSPVNLRPVELKSARTFTHLPPAQPQCEEHEPSMFEACRQRLEDWDHEEEVAPIWRGQPNYGTFIRPRYTMHRQKSQTSPPCQKDGGEQPTGGFGSSFAKERADPFITHEIKSTDTVPALALRYKVLVNDILAVNGVTGNSHGSLLVRKTIRIPIAQATSLADHAENEKANLAKSEKRGGEE